MATLFEGDPSQWVWEWVIIAAAAVALALIIGLIAWAATRKKAKEVNSGNGAASGRALLQQSPTSTPPSSQNPTPLSTPSGSPQEQAAFIGGGGAVLPGAQQQRVGGRPWEYADNFAVLRDDNDETVAAAAARSGGRFPVPQPPMQQQQQPRNNLRAPGAGQRPRADARAGELVFSPAAAGSSEYGIFHAEDENPYGGAALPPRPARLGDSPYGVIPESAWKNPNVAVDEQQPTYGGIPTAPRPDTTPQQQQNRLPANGGYATAQQMRERLVRPANLLPRRANEYATAQQLEQQRRLAEIEKYFV